jgi:ribosomal protein S18 acetylase RimI-like enzyme
MSTRISVRTLDRREVQAAARAMARGFQEYPLAVWLAPDPVRRARFLEWAMGKTIQHAFRYGTVLTDDEVSGAAIWYSPSVTKVGFFELIRTGLILAPLKIGLRHAKRLTTFSAIVDKSHEAHFHGPHWYLDNIAIDPARQGRGIGRALVEEGLRRVDADRAPCFLETHDDDNVGYYERFGFRVVASVQFPWNGPRNWTMLRDGRV